MYVAGKAGSERGRPVEWCRAPSIKWRQRAGPNAKGIKKAARKTRRLKKERDEAKIREVID